MKKTLSVLIFIPFTIFAQNKNYTLQQDQLAEAEAKSAKASLQFTVSPNTGNYDLTYHRLEFNVNPAEAFIEGEVTSYFEAKQDLNDIYFDLAENMEVAQVSQRGNLLAFAQINDELKITLPVTQAEGVLDSLTISYSGNPISSGFGSFEQTQHAGHDIIWTLSEPYGAKAWWPCKQDLNDKVDSIDVYISAPLHNANGEENVAVANGVEVGNEINGTTKTTHFHHGYPIPAYLIAIAVTNYSVYSHTVENNGNPFPIVNYVYPENLTEAQQQTPITVDIMNLFTEHFLEYPYANEKYGHAQFGWGGGMEHTTVSFMNNFNRQLIAHELGHQWFGDKVTCGSWKDIWLNEGFATYMAAMVIENFDGEAEFKNWRESVITQITSQPDGSVYLSDEDTTSVNRIFSSRLSYSKGAMVLHMLRKKLGDNDFFQGLRNYLTDEDLAYAYAYTQDLRLALEAQSSLNLNEFFNDWVFHEGYPSFNVNLNQDGNNEAMLTVNQTQSNASVSFFETDLPIKLVGNESQEFDTILTCTENGQQFTVDPGFEVAFVEIDPNFDIISMGNSGNLSNQVFDLNSINMYPNPARFSVYIQKPTNINITEINIINTLGQVIKTFSYSASFSVEDMAKGLYFVQIKTEDGTVNKSLLVE